MPKFVSKTIYLNDFAVIGAVQISNTPKWYIRMYWKDGKQSTYKSLKLDYEPGRASQKAAIQAGTAKYNDFVAKVSLGLTPNTTTNISAITDEYFRHIKSRAEENDETLEKGGVAKWTVKGGEGKYSVKRCNEIESLLAYLQRYWKTLPTEDMGAITFNQLEAFDDWMNRTYDLSPSRRAKAITQIRMIWRYAREKGYVNWIPNPSRPSQELKERARRNLKEEEWFLMEEWARNQIDEVAKDKNARKEQIDGAYQFYLWFQLISWTGIRPPNGSTPKNLLKWDSYRIVNPGKEDEMRFFDRDEKNHLYTAIIQKPGWKYFDELEMFHEVRGTYRRDGFLFCHTQDKKGSYKAGDPINNFYKQWDKMLKALGLDMPKGTMQKDKLVPYSLRGYYITMRLRYGKGLSIDKLAKSCGTSAKIILQTYYDFSSEKEYDELTVGADYQDQFPGVNYGDNFVLKGLRG